MVEQSNHQEDIKITDICVPNNRTSEYMGEKQN